MARLTLTPTTLPGTLSVVDGSALLTAGTLGSNTGVSFQNTGMQWLEVTTVTGATTIVVNIGTTIEGQSVNSLTLNASTAGHTYKVGPFNADEDQPGGTINVDFGTSANVAGVALFTF